MTIDAGRGWFTDRPRAGDEVTLVGFTMPGFDMRNSRRPSLTLPYRRQTTDSARRRAASRWAARCLRPDH
jgi:hypothetical protein